MSTRSSSAKGPPTNTLNLVFRGNGSTCCTATRCTVSAEGSAVRTCLKMVAGTSNGSADRGKGRTPASQVHITSGPPPGRSMHPPSRQTGQLSSWAAEQRSWMIEPANQMLRTLEAIPMVCPPACQCRTSLDSGPVGWQAGGWLATVGIKQQQSAP